MAAHGRNMDSSLAFIEVFGLFLGLSGCLLMKIDHEQPEPYMDEIFHIPQAQKYCEGNFMEWDPLLTTLPGLYIISVGVVKPISQVLGIPIKVACSTIWLRSINVAFALGTLYLLHLLIRKIHGHRERYDSWKGVLTAGTLSIFPVMYFFNFLYYTDSGSTFFFLLTYLLGLHGNHVMAATMGVLAVLFRQTNIVWVAFVAGITAARLIVEFVRPDKKDLSLETVQGFRFLTVFKTRLQNCLKSDHKAVYRLISGVASETWPYVAVGLGFVAFVIVNGGIVVGAKTDHEAGLHFPQLFYFASFAAVFSAVHYLSGPHLRSFLRFLRRRPVVAICFCAVSGVLVWKFTLAHRYLLSDNSHYTFYVWSKIYRRHALVKFALIPCYLFAVWSLLSALNAKDIVWKTVYCTCLVVHLVPSTLLEFRYFIPPYLVLRINMPQPTWVRLVLELGLHVAVNALTLYLFLEKPFEQTEGATKLHRFMW